MNVVLIGYRGSGKSSVARLLAARLGWECLDLDEQVELAAGKSIAAIFADEGEPAFRDREEAAIAQLAGRDRCVVAAGGGAVERPANRARLRAAGQVVYLTASAESLVGRIAADPTTAARRPNLTASGGWTEIAEVLSRREPLYRQCAHLAVDTEGKTCQQVADEILSRLDWGQS